MAYEAVTSATTDPINKISTKDLMNEAQKRIIKTWKNHWDFISDNNKPKNVKTAVTKWAYPDNSSRREKIVINRDIIGHSHLPSPSCDILCKSIFTIVHIITHCPKYSTLLLLHNNRSSLEVSRSKQNQ
ncbi:RNase H domain-containing protein [Aphis craccivora]|uniref:RNase H domain-containing protein n=1 Tax=Aphis craccivora TaxID=307492 RepID=A0A6G0ZLW6_APHCR|nr:RNase H domain-containing protein [Aphis craccivora]